MVEALIALFAWDYLKRIIGNETYGRCEIIDSNGMNADNALVVIVTAFSVWAASNSFLWVGAIVKQSFVAMSGLFIVWLFFCFG
ncbi:MAG: hypothetical protein ACI9Y1_001817 [Lentisphaeria bacterium]|jgi:hypothetical protein